MGVSKWHKLMKYEISDGQTDRHLEKEEKLAYKTNTEIFCCSSVW